MTGVHDFINDMFAPSFTEEASGSSIEPHIVEGRSDEAKTFFKLLEEADEELYLGCKKFNKIEVIVRLYQVKCLGNIPDNIFTKLLELIRDVLLEENCFHETCYKARKLIKELGLTHKKIDVWPINCMIYWKDTPKLTTCSMCGTSRYKVNVVGSASGGKISGKVMWYFPLKSRLKRLYISKHTVEHVRWHETEFLKDGFMRHPSDSPAWKHLDNLYFEFMSEIRNVRLGLASGFNPFNQRRSDHSTWPVVLSAYNLPPWMSINQPSFLLTMLIPGPRSPGNAIDMYLHSLIYELNELWEVGTTAYAAFSNQTFTVLKRMLTLVVFLTHRNQ